MNAGTGVFVGAIRRDARSELQVRLRARQKSTLVDVRRFDVDGKGAMRETVRGWSLQVTEIKELVRLLLKAEQEAAQ